MRPFLILLRHDLHLAVRAGGLLYAGVFFYLTAALLFVLAAGPDADFLARLGPPVIWVLALLASLLAVPELLQDDAQDGSLDLYLSGGIDPTLLALEKAVLHWLIAVLPVFLAAPLLCAAFGLEAAISLRLSLTLLIASPVFSLLAMMGATLLITARRSSVLIAVLILPLYAPLVIFALGALEPQAGSAGIKLLLALWAPACILPFLGGLALRQASED